MLCGTFESFVVVLVAFGFAARCWELAIQEKEIQGGLERRAVCGWLLPELEKRLKLHLLRLWSWAQIMKTQGKTLFSMMECMINRIVWFQTLKIWFSYKYVDPLEGFGRDSISNPLFTIPHIMRWEDQKCYWGKEKKWENLWNHYSLYQMAGWSK